MAPLELGERLALLLALALFLGLAFEDVYKREERAVPGGVRTFPMLALAGAMLYLIEPRDALAFAAGLIAIAAWLYAFLRSGQPRDGVAAPSLMIAASNLLVYAIGPIVLIEPAWIAVALTVAAVLLIGMRERIHGVVRLIPQDEVLTAGKFLILVGVVLPLVPDTRLFAWASVTPLRIWLAVVAISGLSYLTYLVQRYWPMRGGALFPALIGGAYSSTVTTVVLAKRQREIAAPRPELSAGIVGATAVMYPRLAVIIAVFDPALAGALLPAIAFLSAAGGALAWWEWRDNASRGGESLTIPAVNPLQLTTALIFALLFLGISLATGWVEIRFGQAGIFTLAGLVGASDIDPFILSLAQGGAPGMASAALASAVLIAASANNLAKAGYAVGFGGFDQARRPAAMLVALALLGLAAAGIYLL